MHIITDKLWIREKIKGNPRKVFFNSLQPSHVSYKALACWLWRKRNENTLFVSVSKPKELKASYGGTLIYFRSIFTLPRWEKMMTLGSQQCSLSCLCVRYLKHIENLNYKINSSFKTHIDFLKIWAKLKMNLRKLVMAQNIHYYCPNHHLWRKVVILAEMTNYPSTAEGKN